MRLRWPGRDRRPDPGDYPPGPVRDLAAAPPPPDGTPVAEVTFVSLDLETTGLDPKHDHVLAVGWVPVVGGEVRLGEARHRLVRPPAGVDVGASATLHGLTDDQLAAEPSLEDVLSELLGALHHRVLLAHHVPVELTFLAEATRATYGARPPLTAVDTLVVQQRLVGSPHQEPKEGTLRLDAARRRFGLPRYSAHHALTDALATAELFLAQTAELAHRSGREPLLADLAPVRRR